MRFVVLLVIAAGIVDISRNPGEAGVVDVLFVNAAVAASGNGESWNTAYKTLHEALDRPGGHEIWVAQGTYTPKVPGSGLLTAKRSAATFVVGGDERVYGGFAGGETDRGQRDPEARPVILSGEILAPGAADNAYTVVTFLPAANVNTLLDGLTIQDANEDRDGEEGGGIENAGGSPGLENVTIRNNMAPDGAAFYSTGGAPVLSNVSFLNNIASAGSSSVDVHATGGSLAVTDSSFRFTGSSLFGGHFIQTGNTNVSVSRVTFEDTTSHIVQGIMLFGTGTRTLSDLAFDGLAQGVFVNGGDLTLDRASFKGIDGDGIVLGDGGTFIVRNATFGPSSGSALGGFAISVDADITILHSTFAGIGAGGVVDLIPISRVDVEIVDSIVWGPNGGFDILDNGPPPNSTLTITHTVLEGGCPTSTTGDSVDITCNGIITADPLLGPLKNNGGTGLTASLGVGSSAVDKGSTGACPATDQRGLSRPFDGDGAGGAACDLGAFELRPQHVAFGAAGSSKRENGGNASLALTLDATADIPVTVDYAVTGGTAATGADFTLASGTVTFAAGETTKIITPTLLNDLLVETPETVVVGLSNPKGALAGTTLAHTLTITDDEPKLKCDGKTATQLGTTGNDTIVGTGGDDVIVSRGGVDDVRGLDGNDTLCGGPGNDVLNGGGGNDVLLGQGGADTLKGGAGPDELLGGGASDTLIGRGGNDRANGGSGADLIRGGGGNDRLDGAGGDDTVRGEGGNDQVEGGLGDDRLSGGSGTKDRCDGGPGTPDVLVKNHGCEVVTGVP